MSAARLTDGMRRALRLMWRHRRYDDGWAVVYAGATLSYDGQPWINYRSAHALTARRLVVMQGHGDEARCRLTAAGQEVAAGL